MRGVGGEVGALVRVGLEVEEQRRIPLGQRQLQPPVAQRHHRLARALGGILHRHRAAAGGVEALAVGRGGEGVAVDAGEGGEGRENVEGRDRAVDAARGEPGGGQHQRHAGRALEEAHLEPESALAEHVAVVGEEDDRGAVGEAEAVEQREELADLLVDVGDRRRSSRGGRGGRARGGCRRRCGRRPPAGAASAGPGPRRRSGRRPGRGRRSRRRAPSAAAARRRGRAGG